jgi:hypothetical protein
MIETSVETAKLDEAMAKAQSKVSAAVKDKINPAFRSKYADLASVWDACREALTSNGIFVSQWPIHSEDGRLHIVTRLAHKGEWIKAHFSLPVGKQDAHGYAGALTYAKRMSLSAAVGVVADDDDDGNAASQRPSFEPKKAAAPMPATDIESVGDTYIRKFNEAESSEAFEEQVEKARAAWSRFGTADKAKVQNSIAARRAYWLGQTAEAAE